MTKPLINPTLLDDNELVGTSVLPQTLARKLPRCKNCRFWQKWEDGRDADCTKFEDDYDLYKERGDWARASYSDSHIHTGPNFGCIHFEVKDGE